MQFNFRKRKVRLEDEEWKILDLETKDVRMIQAKENSERFEFGIFFLVAGVDDRRERIFNGVECC